MNIPEFTAEDSLYRMTSYYQLTAIFATDIGIQVSPAVHKGTFCTVPDPDCPSGFSKLRCTDFDSDSCTETGICCTPPPPPLPPPPVNCGTHMCPAGHPCCGLGCCPAGKHCCDNINVAGCCPNGRTCRKILGKVICSPF